MKKMNKVLGAVALSTTLAFGCAMPAFAITAGEMEMDGANVKTEEVQTDGSTGDTSVHMRTEVSNISVTVPVKAYLYAETAGGNLGVPSKTAYKLTNTSSTTDAYVRSVAVSNTTPSDWKLTTNAAEVGAGVEANGVTYGNLRVELGMDYITSGGVSTTEAAFALDTAAAKTFTKTSTVSIPRMGKSGGAIEVTLAGQSSMLNDTIAAGATTDEAFKITYTVSANPSNAI